MLFPQLARTMKIEMKKLIVNLLMAMPLFFVAQNVNDTLEKAASLNSAKTLDEFVVKATRVDQKSPVAHENIRKEQLEKINHGVDLPILLDQATSVVTTSDAGAGVGYTGIRIRGSDATRVNVTINGIPLNDAESQGTFWVDLPDLSSSTNDIQIQRGVGTSTNGAGAFGASINLNTMSSNSQKPYAEVSNSYGSFNTFKHTFKLGSGMIDGKWNFEGRLSKLTSDGYIDRSTSDLSSYYVSAGYFGERSKIKAIMFSGHEQTFQAWYGVPLSFMDSARTYNPYTYDNEVDNYRQDHYQLHYTANLIQGLKVNAALHYTRGIGYYEQYKGIGENAGINYYSKENLVDYGLSPVMLTNNGDTSYITETDLIRRRWLDNHFYGAIFSAEYQANKIKLILGGGANQYLGKHFGEVIWAEYASDGAIRHPYYDNDATKNDVHVYLKANYDLNDKLSLFADLQQRFIQYDFLGYDYLPHPNIPDSFELANIQQSASLAFFNPKAGLNYQFNNKHGVYGFIGVGNKEPNREDYTNSTPESRPFHEKMTDLEIGYRFKSKKMFANINLYNMDYENQLIITGELNDVGAAIRTNVEDSYRRGVEISSGYRIMKNLELRFNATFSQNKIAEFHEFKDYWDIDGQVDSVFTNTDIALSPNVIFGSQLIYQPISSEKYGDVELALISKYVGDQYIDNTSNQYAILDAYSVHDLRVNYTLRDKCFKELVISAWVRNLLDEAYISNAWIYKFRSVGYDPTPDDPYANAEGQGTGMYNSIGAFPQAGRHFFVGLTLKF